MSDNFKFLLVYKEAAPISFLFPEATNAFGQGTYMIGPTAFFI